MCLSSTKIDSFPFRIVQEALSNVKKHSSAINVIIRLVVSHPSILCRIQDDGVGFSVKKTKALHHNKMGLNDIAQRTAMLNGTFELFSLPDQGTKLLIEVPIGQEKNG